jgi:uncharacterized membrane protein
MTHNTQHTIPTVGGRTCPITVESAVDIPASVSAVFGYLANLENNPLWNWAVTETRALDGAPRRGSRYMQSHSSPARSEEILHIASYRENELLEIISKVDGGSVLYRYDLSPISDVATRLRLEVEMSPPGRGGRPDLFAERLVSVLAMNLESLSSAVVGRQESSVRSGAA